MVDQETLKIIAAYFQIPALNTSTHQIKNAKGEIVEEFTIKSYWVAHVVNTNSYHIALVNTASWTKGLILIPPISAPNTPWGQRNPLKPVDLTNWHDPVEESLHSIDVMPKVERNYEVWDGASYRLMAATKDSYIELSVYNFDNNPSLDKVFEALIAATAYMVDLYGDDKMLDYIFDNE